MGPLRCPETSVTNYQPTLCNILEVIRSQISLHICDQCDYFRIYNSTASVVVLSQLNSVHNILHYSGNFRFSIILPHTPILLMRLLTSSFLKYEENVWLF